MKIKKPEQYSHKNKTDKINCALIDCIRVLNSVIKCRVKQVTYTKTFPSKGFPKSSASLVH